MKRRKVLAMLMTAVMTFSSVAPETALRVHAEDGIVIEEVSEEDAAEEAASENEAVSADEAEENAAEEEAVSADEAAEASEENEAVSEKQQKRQKSRSFLTDSRACLPAM